MSLNSFFAFDQVVQSVTTYIAMELSSTRKITRKRSVVVEDEDVMARRRRSPHFPSSDFAEIADKTSALEEKCRYPLNVGFV